MFGASGGTRVNVFDVSMGQLRQLGDVALLAVLAWLPADTLCLLSGCSRSMYCFCHDTRLWRDLTLKIHGGAFSFSSSWKETYIRHARPDFRGPHHRPLPMEGFYSDVLYEPFLNATMNIDQSWLKVDNVARRTGLTVDEFVEQYETPGTPVILTDVVKGWAASTEWKAARMRDKYASKKFRVSATIDMQLGDFLRYCESEGGAAADERPLYLFEKDFPHKCPDMGGQYTIPAHFAEDLMQVMGSEGRPDYRWLIMGPAKSGSSFHVDPNCNFAWNATIQGRKKWVMYPPSVEPPLDHDGAAVSLVQWFARHYHEEHPSKSQRLECITEAGELM
jgi:hypothetical protein